MAILRVIHAAELPDPATVIARLQNGEGAVAAVPSLRAAAPAGAMAQAASPPQAADFPALVARLAEAGKQILAQQLHDQVGLVRYSPGELVMKPLRPLGTDFPRTLADVLRQVTGSAWQVRLSDDGGAPSLLQQEQMAEERARAAIKADPNVAAVLSAFPDAQLESVSGQGASHA